MALDTILYRPSWQRLRASCLHDYNPYGGMNTAVGAEDAIIRLENYIQDANPKVSPPQYTTIECRSMKIPMDIEYAGRIYRVTNFLQATINGLISQQGIYHMQSVKDYYDTLVPLSDNSKVAQYATKWDWNVIQQELSDMFVAERYWFMSIYEDMQQRLKEKKNDSQELHYFIGLIEKIFDSP